MRSLYFCFETNFAARISLFERFKFCVRILKVCSTWEGFAYPLSVCVGEAFEKFNVKCFSQIFVQRRVNVGLVLRYFFNIYPPLYLNPRKAFLNEVLLLSFYAPADKGWAVFTLLSR